VPYFRCCCWRRAGAYLRINVGAVVGLVLLVVQPHIPCLPPVPLPGGCLACCHLGLSSSPEAPSRRRRTLLDRTRRVNLTRCMHGVSGSAALRLPRALDCCLAMAAYRAFSTVSLIGSVLPRAAAHTHYMLLHFYTYLLPSTTTPACCPPIAGWFLGAILAWACCCNGFCWWRCAAGRPVWLQHHRRPRVLHTAAGYDTLPRLAPFSCGVPPSLRLYYRRAKNSAQRGCCPCSPAFLCCLLLRPRLGPAATSAVRKDATAAVGRRLRRRLRSAPAARIRRAAAILLCLPFL